MRLATSYRRMTAPFIAGELLFEMAGRVTIEFLIGTRRP